MMTASETPVACAASTKYCSFKLTATPRAMPPDDAAAVARRLGRDRGVEVEPDVERALAAAWRRADLIAACGSIFLVGEAFDRIGLPAW